ncbi:hypothetical protein [Gracilimonas mengyeensis]|uniref:Limiting CO2-inducible protein B/C beta carbonyic anhydrase domain-containing protein n=1 Tax=Gracilimonas mengyeensis TaxID=1302730 RepID=A0A521EBJ8_9BACT|nr:hypothetical protein [Gracilimonas mengyeensis]SMO81287.1 hypothetical protein SAMN06265219_11187 [Gracilimonas mengyeensis]
MEYINNIYSDAKSLSQTEKTILDELKKHDMSPANCIWGTSICSDEVNNSFLSLGTHFKAPGPFFFGGISGLPFTGKTGFAAFASHIPDDGGALILFGPHIGISADGTVGKVKREGQADITGCCGSLAAGLQTVESGSVPVEDHSDYQQTQVSKMLIEKHAELKEADDPIIEATEIAYTQIKRELNDIITNMKETLGDKKLLLAGGILINTDWQQEDYFELRDVIEF